MPSTGPSGATSAKTAFQPGLRISVWVVVGNLATYGDENKGDIESIAAVYHAWLKGEGYEDVKGFCKSATIQEIKAADYSLVPGRYVGIDDSGKMSEEEVKAEIVRVKQELKQLMEKGKKLDEKIYAILDSED